MGELLNFRRSVNGIDVEQRVADGFINATAMCVAHSKDLTQWFRTKDTFELFMELAQDLGISANSVNLQNLDFSRLSASRYADIFPGYFFLEWIQKIEGEDELKSLVFRSGKME